MKKDFQWAKVMKTLLRLLTFLIAVGEFESPDALANGKGSRRIFSAGAGYSSRVKLQSSRKDLYEGISPMVGFYYGGLIKWGPVFQSTSYAANYSEVIPNTETILLYGLAMRAELAKNGSVFFETQLLYGSTGSYGGAISGVFRIPFGVGSKIAIFGKYQILTGASGAEYGFSPGISLELDL